MKNNNLSKRKKKKINPKKTLKNPPRLGFKM